MKVTVHVEHLLRQGRETKELLELGFPKRVITRVRRQLREEKAVGRQKMAKGKGGVKSAPKHSAISPKPVALVDQRLASLESKIDDLRGTDRDCAGSRYGSKGYRGPSRQYPRARPPAPF